MNHYLPWAIVALTIVLGIAAVQLWAMLSKGAEASMNLDSETTVRVRDFISRERSRFDVEHNNMFALGFSDIAIYRAFLNVISSRHATASRAFHANTVESRRLRGDFVGTRAVTPEEDRLFKEAQTLVVHIRLEEESFYLFATILLDRVARSLEFYFGPERGLSLDSHDQWVKSMEAYGKVKSLDVPIELPPIAAELKEKISDYRDYQVAHHKSPRTVRGVAFRHDDPDSVRISSGQIYPRENERQIESLELNDAIGLIDRYLHAVIDFLENNEAKCRLRPVNARS
jgi:hypothetical protein